MHSKEIRETYADLQKHGLSAADAYDALVARVAEYWRASRSWAEAYVTDALKG